jgi:hypothetical protein
MSSLLQEILVGLLVAGCALFSAWRLATVRARLRMLEALQRLRPFGAAAWVERLRQRTLKRSTAACGGCSQAGAAEPGDRSASRSAAAKPGAASPNRTPGALRR